MNNDPHPTRTRMAGLWLSLLIAGCATSRGPTDHALLTHALPGMIDMLAIPGTPDRLVLLGQDGRIRCGVERSGGLDARSFTNCSEEIEGAVAFAWYQDTFVVLRIRHTGAELITVDKFGRQEPLVNVGLNAPTSIAVSRAGVIAVGSASEREIALFRIAGTGDIESQLVPLKGISPRRLAFVGSDLIALNEDSTLALVPSYEYNSNDRGLTSRRFADLADLGSAVNFATFRGIIYIVKPGITNALFRAVGDTSSRFDAPNSLKAQPALVAATERRLYALSGDGTVEVISRPIQVSLVSNWVAGSPAVVATLFEYLQSHGLNSVRSVTARHEFSSVIDALVEQNVLPRVDPSFMTGAVQLATALCGLNPSNFQCSGAANTILLQGRISEGQTLTVPDLKVDTFIDSYVQNLNGTAVSEFLSAEFAGSELLDVQHQYVKSASASGGGTAAPLQLSVGEVSLPVHGWKAMSVILADDLDQLRKEIQRVEKSTSPSRGTRVIAVEELETSAMSCPALAALPAGSLDKAIASRNTLKALIHYDDEATDLAKDKTAVVALVEEAGSVDQRHADLFSAAGDTIFMQPDTAPNSLALIPGVVTSCDQTSRSVKPFDTASDHGTHVAGLLAAHSGAALVGLAPAASLFLIDTTTKKADELFDAINAAITRGVRLLNFSTGLDHFSPSNWDLFRDQMKLNWRNALFVAASGNDGKITSPNTTAPLTWSDPTIQNILGVGAATECGDILGDWRDDDGELHKGSSYGEAFVHLIAPGVNVYSCARGNAYAQTSGSSQACPQVTAAALLLLKQSRSVRAIKARLIYTAEWRSQFVGKVLGGLLDVAAAVDHPEDNLIVTKTERDQLRKVTFDLGSNPTITIKHGLLDGFPITASTPIGFSKVLRLTDVGDGRVRIIFTDAGDKMHFLNEAEVDPAPLPLRCVGISGWNELTKSFVADANATALCAAGIPATQIYDFIAEIPGEVNF
jgi:subtilisin family serine protease